MYTGDTSFDYDGLKLALDNFEFKWTEVADPTVQRDGTPVTITQEMLDGDGYTLTGTDDNGNASSATATVTVEDNINPVTLTQDITIELDANGDASIVAADVDNGSNDACGGTEESREGKETSSRGSAYPDK